MKTCVPCRSRKVKCDGLMPKCGSCLKARRALNCTYEISQWNKGTLSKREACLPCRRRKRRCDAGKPSCEKCREAGKGGECVYEVLTSGSRKEKSQKTKPTCRSTSSDNSRLSTPVLDTRLSTMAIIPIDTNFRRSPTLHLNSSYMEKLSSPRTSPAPLRPDIIRNPSLTLEDAYDPLSFAISDVSYCDLNLKFRLLFLTMRFSWGVFLPYLKEQAVLLGDTSGRHIHPFFIHYIHLSGAQVYQEQQGSFCVLRVQAVHLQLATEAMKTIDEQEDPFSFALAYFYMGLAHGYAQNSTMAIRTLRKSVESIRRNGIRYMPISHGNASQQGPNVLTSLPEFSEEVHERAVFLSQMLHSETFMYMAGQPNIGGFYCEDHLKDILHSLYSDVCLDLVGGKPDEISFDIETQFRYELEDAYPVLFEICPVTLRVRSMILAKDASNLIAWFHQETPPTPTWFSTCRIFLVYLTAHITKLERKVAESKVMRDGERLAVFRGATIFSLTTLAQVSYLMGKAPPASEVPISEHRFAAAYALRRVIELLEELPPEEFKFMDPFLGICWSRAIDLFTLDNAPSDPSTHQPQSTISHYSPRDRFTTKDDDDFSANVARLAQYNRKFVIGRFLPGTTSLCTKLASYRTVP